MLSDILADLASKFGKTGTATDLNVRIYDINKAAKEIHNSSDLEEALTEDIFNFNNESAQQITTPAYVDKVRGARYADGRDVITIDDIRNRYNFHWFSENEVWYLKPRDKGHTPLSRGIENQSALIIGVPLAEVVGFTVTITGETDNSYRFVETLTFAVGDLSHTSLGNYKKVESITKSIVTTYDVLIEDVEGNEMGRILNSEYESACKIYQIMDEERTATLPQNFSGVELHYKKRFQPFKNFTDCFLGTSKYDDAIVWKYMEHRSKNLDEAAGYNAKCNAILSQGYQNDTTGKVQKMNLRPSPYFNLPYKDYFYK